MNVKYSKWSRFYKKKVKEEFPSWPMDHMVKLFFGDYLKNKINIPNNTTVLDIGCGFGNNLLPFLFKGYKCYGTEVSDDITSIAKAALRKRGYKAIIRVGNNRNIPFTSNMFDIVISSGVIHYEVSKKNIDKTLSEYCRVLKPKGALFISTTGSSHDLFKKSKKIASHRYKIMDYDFRNSQTFFFFESEKYLQQILKPYFKIIETGQVNEKLMKKTIHTLVAICQIKI